MQVDFLWFIRPYPWYLLAALWTFPLVCQVIACDGIANAVNNLVIAIGTEGAFILAHMTGDVASINIMEAGFSSDF
jgi:hypothetical protein